MPARKVSVAGLLALVVATPLLGACAWSGDSYATANGELSPLYDVTPEMLRPDGTMTNGLLPINPNDQQ
jgi:hypothetical protein